MRPIPVIILLVTIFLRLSISQIIGFDCKDQNTNITTLSLNHVSSCREQPNTINNTQEHIQLVQLAQNYPVHVTQCKIVMTILTTDCGAASGMSAVRDGFTKRIPELTKSECLSIHQQRQYITSRGKILANLRLNATNERSTLLAGRLSGTSSCWGESYDDGVHTWDNVVVQSLISITLTDYYATLDTQTGSVLLRSGVTCSYEQLCIDYELGYTFWDVSPIAECDERLHLVLYEGVSNVYTETESGITHRTYMVDEGSKVFALRTTGVYTHCHSLMYTTEHPKLLVSLRSDYGFRFKKNYISTFSMDLMTYINSKFVYVEKKYTGALNELYTELSLQRCLLERKTLDQLLTLALIPPSVFAYTYMQSPGYTAVLGGEVVHIAKCQATEVKIRKTDICYQELPIVYQNKSCFLTARNRLIQEHGNEIPCNTVLAPQYTIHDQWYAIYGSVNPVVAPLTLAPVEIGNLKFKGIKGLATSGIYTQDETERMGRRLMQPYEREAIASYVSGSMNNEDLDKQGLSLEKLLDDATMENVYEGFVHKLWGWFSYFGTLTSGLLGIFVVIRIIKFLFDTMLHGKALYDLYGISIALVGAFWDSLTTYLLNRKRQYKHARTDNEVSEKEYPLHTVCVQHDDASAPQDESGRLMGKSSEFAQSSCPVYPNLRSIDMSSIRVPVMPAAPFSNP